MRRKGHFARLAVVLVSMAVLATACSSDDDSTDSSSGGDHSEGEAGGIFRIPIGEPSAIDPYNTRESEGTNVTKALFVGLVTYDGNAELKMRPGVADRVDDQRRLHPVDVQAAPEPVQQRRAGDGRVVHPGLDPHRRRHVGLAGRLPPGRRSRATTRSTATPPTATTFSGLSAPDPQTLVVNLERRRLRVRQEDARAARGSPVPSTSPARPTTRRSTRRPSATGRS